MVLPHMTLVVNMRLVVVSSVLYVPHMPKVSALRMTLDVMKPRTLYVMALVMVDPLVGVRGFVTSVNCMRVTRADVVCPMAPVFDPAQMLVELIGHTASPTWPQSRKQAA